MDTKVQNKKSKYKKIIFIAVPVLILAGLLSSSLLKKKSLNVETSRLAVREVKNGKFDDIVILNGKIEPLNSVLIDVVEGGAVQEIFVEDGSMVKENESAFRISTRCCWATDRSRTRASGG